MPHHVEPHPEVLLPQADTGKPRGQRDEVMLTADEQRVIKWEHRRPKLPLVPFKDALVRPGDVIEGAGGKQPL